MESAIELCPRRRSHPIARNRRPGHWNPGRTSGIEAALRSGAGHLIATGLSEPVRLSGWAAPLSLRAETSASAAAVAALVRQVEREPQLVPGVRRVRVIERGDSGHILPKSQDGCQDLITMPTTGWVRYEVEGL